MLGTIRKVAAGAALGLVLLGINSCATKEVSLISDPNASKENALPWNEQQKWEREGEASALNQQRR
jgi:hypothetical protein